MLVRPFSFHKGVVSWTRIVEKLSTGRHSPLNQPSFHNHVYYNHFLIHHPTSLKSLKSGVKNTKFPSRRSCYSTELRLYFGIKLWRFMKSAKIFGPSLEPLCRPWAGVISMWAFGSKQAGDAENLNHSSKYSPGFIIITSSLLVSFGTQEMYLLHLPHHSWSRNSRGCGICDHHTIFKRPHRGVPNSQELLFICDCIR